MNLVTIIIGGLIVWRLSNLIIKQNGPLCIFAKFRAILARMQKQAGGLYDIFSCISCVSMIMGSVTALAVAGGVIQWIAYVLSFSAVAVLIDALAKQK